MGDFDNRTTCEQVKKGYPTSTKNASALESTRIYQINVESFQIITPHKERCRTGHKVITPPSHKPHK